jgi:hypothetical protein
MLWITISLEQNSFNSVYHDHVGHQRHETNSYELVNFKIILKWIVLFSSISDQWYNLCDVNALWMKSIDY